MLPSSCASSTLLSPPYNMGSYQSVLCVMCGYQISYSLGFLLQLYSRKIKRSYFCAVPYVMAGLQIKVTTAIPQVCIPKSCFGYVVPRDLAILLRCSRNWEEMLHAVYLMRSLQVREALRQGAQFQWWGEWGRMLVLSFLPGKGIFNFIAVFYECFVYL